MDLKSKKEEDDSNSNSSFTNLSKVSTVFFLTVYIRISIVRHFVNLKVVEVLKFQIIGPTDNIVSITGKALKIQCEYRHCKHLYLNFFSNQNRNQGH